MSAPRAQQNIPRSPLSNSRRNRAAWRIANYALNTIATKDYRDIIAALIRVGIDETYGHGATRGAFDRRTGMRY